jgi:anti-repressor protein
MTSLEIAKLTKKEHSNVLKDIERMFTDLEMAQDSQVKYYFAEQSQTGEMKRYKLPKDLTITLVSGYNAKLRKAIIDRWLELEKPKSPMELVLDSIKYLELEVAKEKEKNYLLETKIEENAPKVAFAETVANSADVILVREYAKILYDKENIKI